MKVPTFYAIISTLWWSTITCAVIPASELHFLTDHLSDLLTSDTLDRPLKTKKLHQVHEIERDYGDRAWDDWMDGKGGWLSDQSHKKRKSRTNKNLSLEKKLRFGDVDDEKEFRRKKLGRYEIEEGEKFRQAADRGRGKERKWTWEAADDEDEDRNANKKPGEMNRRKHRIHEYHQKRRKNFNHLYRQHRDFNHHDDKKDQNNQRFDRKGESIIIIYLFSLTFLIVNNKNLKIKVAIIRYKLLPFCIYVFIKQFI